MIIYLTINYINKIIKILFIMEQEVISNNYDFQKIHDTNITGIVNNKYKIYNYYKNDLTTCNITLCDNHIYFNSLINN